MADAEGGPLGTNLALSEPFEAMGDELCSARRSEEASASSRQLVDGGFHRIVVAKRDLKRRVDQITVQVFELAESVRGQHLQQCAFARVGATVGIRIVGDGAL